MNIEASPKYVLSENISFNVVISGPEATAGSILNRYKIKGIIVPAKVPIIRVRNSEQPTTNPKIALPCQIKAISEIKTPHMMSMINPTPSSRIIKRMMTFY